MLDRSDHTDHRRHAAMQTDQGSHRGWCFAPEEAKPPLFVWKFLAWAFGLTVFFVMTPVIVKYLMGAYA